MSTLFDPKYSLALRSGPFLSIGRQPASSQKHHSVGIAVKRLRSLPTNDIHLASAFVFTMSSATDRIPALIAHYLATHYPTALDPFLQAAQIAAPDFSHPPNPDLRTVVEDWSSQQLATSLAMATIDESDIDAPARDGTWKGWKLKDMMKAKLSAGVGLRSTDRGFHGVSAANLLTVAAVHVPSREFDTSSAM